MKKERPILFPETDCNVKTPIEQRRIALTDFKLGVIYKIGQPSSIHFQYLNTTIDWHTATIKSLANFTEVKGILVKAISSLRMNDGKKIAVFRHYQDELFLGKFEKIYAELDKSLSNEEIVHLDLDTKRHLEATIKLNQHH